MTTENFQKLRTVQLYWANAGQGGTNGLLPETKLITDRGNSRPRRQSSRKSESRKSPMGSDSMPSNSEASYRGGQVRLKDLCEEDKERITCLVHEIARLQGEKEQTSKLLDKEREEYENKVQTLMVQFEGIAKEKFDTERSLVECQALLQQYQELLRNAKPVNINIKEEKSSDEDKKYRYPKKGDKAKRHHHHRHSCHSRNVNVKHICSQSTQTSPSQSDTKIRQHSTTAESPSGSSNSGPAEGNSTAQQPVTAEQVAQLLAAQSLGRLQLDYPSYLQRPVSPHYFEPLKPDSTPATRDSTPFSIGKTNAESQGPSELHWATISRDKLMEEQKRLEKLLAQQEQLLKEKQAQLLAQQEEQHTKLARLHTNAGVVAPETQQQMSSHMHLKAPSQDMRGGGFLGRMLAHEGGGSQLTAASDSRFATPPIHTGVHPRDMLQRPQPHEFTDIPQYQQQGFHRANSPPTKDMGYERFADMTGSQDISAQHGPVVGPTVSLHATAPLPTYQQSVKNLVKCNNTHEPNSHLPHPTAYSKTIYSNPANAAEIYPNKQWQLSNGGNYEASKRDGRPDLNNTFTRGKAVATGNDRWDKLRPTTYNKRPTPVDLLALVEDMERSHQLAMVEQTTLAYTSIASLPIYSHPRETQSTLVSSHKYRDRHMESEEEEQESKVLEDIFFLQQ